MGENKGEKYYNDKQAKTDNLQLQIYLHDLDQYLVQFQKLTFTEKKVNVQFYGKAASSQKQREEEWNRGFPERKPGKGITFEM